MEKKRELKFGDDIAGALDNWGEKALIPVSIIAGKHIEVSHSNREKFKETTFGSPRHTHLPGAHWETLYREVPAPRSRKMRMSVRSST